MDRVLLIAKSLYIAKWHVAYDRQKLWQHWTMISSLLFSFKLVFFLWNAYYWIGDELRSSNITYSLGLFHFVKTPGSFSIKHGHKSKIVLVIIKTVLKCYLALKCWSGHKVHIGPARSVLTALTRLVRTRLYFSCDERVHSLSVLKTHLSLLTEKFFQVENDV